MIMVDIHCVHSYYRIIAHFNHIHPASTD